MNYRMQEEKNMMIWEIEPSNKEQVTKNIKTIFDGADNKTGGDEKMRHYGGNDKL